jgi:tRNA G10  N-methylase Trm11
MTTQKSFAAAYPRDDDGRILFPPDHARRRELFVPESFDHPARAQLFMVEELVKYLSEPGDTVVDPFGGSGTLMIGLSMGRKVRLIELNPEYADMCRRNGLSVLTISGYEFTVRNPYVVHEGPNQELLPNFDGIQAFIFSPPYAGALASAGGKLADWGGYTREHTEQYSDTSELQGNMSPYNLGGFNNFMFNQEMKKIYKLCLDALKPGGFTAVIIKDRISQGVKEELGYRAMQDMLAIGYEFYDWQRLYMAGSHYTKWHRSKGTKTIDEEHIIIMRRPL